ncbi:MAG: hypothetical protein ACRC7S_00730 [Cetobacterium sp.]
MKYNYSIKLKDNVKIRHNGNSNIIYDRSEVFGSVTDFYARSVFMEVFNIDDNFYVFRDDIENIEYIGDVQC